MQQKRTVPNHKWLSASSLIIIAILVVGCSTNEQVIVPTSTPAPTFTPGPTDIPGRPTDPPPGSAENPLKLFLVTAGNPSSFSTQVSDIADALAEATGQKVEVQVVGEYSVVLDGICRGTVHMGTLDAFSYLAASQRGCVTPALVAERDGEIARQGQLIANLESLITSIENFRGRRFCRPDSQSVYGWLIPGITLRARGIDPLNELNSVIDAESDEGVIRRVHDNECDVGATLLGAQDKVEGLEDPERIVFIEALAPVPNDTIVFGNIVDGEQRAAALEAFENSDDALRDVLSADALRAANDSDYADLRELFTSAGIDVLALAR